MLGFILHPNLRAATITIIVQGNDDDSKEDESDDKSSITVSSVLPEKLDKDETQSGATPVLVNWPEDNPIIVYNDQSSGSLVDMSTTGANLAGKDDQTIETKDWVEGFLSGGQDASLAEQAGIKIELNASIEKRGDSET